MPPRLIAPAETLHPPDPDRPTSADGPGFRVDHVGIADPLELGVVGHAGRAIAEADLGAHVDLNPCPAVGRRAYERPPEAPLVERERPLRFSPNRLEDGLVRGCSRARQRQRPGNSSGSDDHEHECKRPAHSPTHPGSGQRVALLAGCEPGGSLALARRRYRQFRHISAPGRTWEPRLDWLSWDLAGLAARESRPRRNREFDRFHL